MKLFIPGPVNVDPEILKALSTPVIGHRTEEFHQLFATLQAKLQKLLFTENRIILPTSSATGLWEACILNCVEKSILHLVNGSFSSKWHEVSLACGRQADKLEAEWGKAVKPEMVEKALREKQYEAIAITHNETSTGVMNPLEEILEAAHRHGVMTFVDAVSSMAGVRIDVDRLGIDVCLASVQKAFGLPPGFAMASVSERAFEKSRKMRNKGYYFDFSALLKYMEKSETPSTPSIPHMFALDKQLDRMFAEGLENRFARHLEMAMLMRTWASEHFALFPEKGYESVTMTCIKNTKNISVSNLINELRKRGMVISNGYGPLMEKTFRIAHMADLQVKDIQELLGNMEDILKL